MRHISFNERYIFMSSDQRNLHEECMIFDLTCLRTLILMRFVPSDHRTIAFLNLGPASGLSLSLRVRVSLSGYCGKCFFLLHTVGFSPVLGVLGRPPNRPERKFVSPASLRHLGR